jgi:hypothetical protein
LGILQNLFSNSDMVSQVLPKCSNPSRKTFFLSTLVLLKQICEKRKKAQGIKKKRREAKKPPFRPTQQHVASSLSSPSTSHAGRVSPLVADVTSTITTAPRLPPLA